MVRRWVSEGGGVRDVFQVIVWILSDLMIALGFWFLIVVVVGGWVV